MMKLFAQSNNNNSLLSELKENDPFMKDVLLSIYTFTIAGAMFGVAVGFVLSNYIRF